MMVLSTDYVKRYIGVNELDDLIGKISIIDISQIFEFKRGSLYGAINISMRRLVANPSYYLDKDTRYYIMCRTGIRSIATCGKLLSLGYDVINVSGGFNSYRGDKVFIPPVS